MIRRTIRAHLDKEKRLRPQGIKVLTLFFIDKVDRYRGRTTQKGNAVKGDYARIFEEEYRRLRQDIPTTTPSSRKPIWPRRPRTSTTATSPLTRRVDGRTRPRTTKPDRDNAEQAYKLIMREKEKLLSLDTPLKFIFSHSALREGWDNPNVFQICALRDIRSEQDRRQTIGRGLRLCVDQEGQRLRGFEVNTLTVVAMEGYEAFAENLQKEIEKDSRVPFRRGGAASVCGDSGR